MHKEKRSVFSALEGYIDMFINLAAILTGYLVAVILSPTGRDRVNILHPYAVLFIFNSLLIISFVYHAMDIYRPNRYVRNYKSFRTLLKANFVSSGLISIVAALTVRGDWRQEAFRWILFSAVISTVFLTLKRQLIKWMIRLFHSANHHLRRVIIYGDNTSAISDYIKEISSQKGSSILGYVSDKTDSGAVRAKRLGILANFEEVLDKYRPTEVVFAPDVYDKKSLIPLVNACNDRCIKVYFLPIIYEFFKNSGQIEQIGSMPLINIHSTPLDNTANAMIKRTVDIIGSLVLIIITLPVMIFAAAGVYFSSPGPIIFKQERVGKLGKIFHMYKFRSMRVNESSNSAWTTGDDPRKTKFGTFLRRYAIDELPQFFNVLRGSMSLVGPRPEIPLFVEHFKNTVPLYMIKHYVKPGITGLAQIKGLRGDTSIEARIHEDIEYIENWSLWLDIVILLKTPVKAFNKNEIYDESKRARRGKKQ